MDVSYIPIAKARGFTTHSDNFVESLSTLRSAYIANKAISKCIAELMEIPTLFISTYLLLSHFYYLKNLMRVWVYT